MRGRRTARTKSMNDIAAVGSLTDERPSREAASELHQISRGDPAQCGPPQYRGVLHSASGHRSRSHRWNSARPSPSAVTSAPSQSASSSSIPWNRPARPRPHVWATTLAQNWLRVSGVRALRARYCVDTTAGGCAYPLPRSAHVHGRRIACIIIVARASSQPSISASVTSGHRRPSSS